MKSIIFFSTAVLLYLLLFPANLLAQNAGCMCPCDCSVSGAVGRVAPLAPSGGSSYEGGDTRSAPVNPMYAPPPAPSSASLPPPPTPAPPSSGAQYTGRHSDLPSGWDEPVALPPGTIRIEDLPSRYGAGAGSAQAASPTMQAPAATAAPYAPIPPADVEDMTASPSGGAKKPPSRWGH
ncbi:MAG TPA: hypothetical protein PKU96_07170 [bacterium]|nr:hypothetical protein [bacterium]HQC51312.1 hypothetical protein [bacterium]